MRRFLSLAALVPFAFGAVRWATTGTDWRYIAVSVGSTIGALVARTAPVRAQPLPLRWLASAAAATGGAALLGIATGARNVVGLLVVAVCFGLCSATGVVAGSVERV